VIRFKLDQVEESSIKVRRRFVVIIVRVCRLVSGFNVILYQVEIIKRYVRDSLPIVIGVSVHFGGDAMPFQDLENGCFTVSNPLCSVDHRYAFIVHVD